MRPFIHKALLALLALAAMAGGVFTQRWLHESSLPAASVSLEAAFPDFDGKPHLLSEWRGKVLVVNFWASWCPPCIEEMPEFARLQSEFGGRGLQFIGILVEDEAEAAREFLEQHPVNYPILNGAIGGRPWASSLGNQADVLPFSAVIDRNGKLVRVEMGRFDREEVLQQILPLLHP